MNTSVNVIKWVGIATTGLHCLHENSPAALDGKKAGVAIGDLILAAETAATALSNLIASRKVDARYGDYVTDLTAAISRCKGVAA